MPLSTGKSGIASSTPKISRESSATRLRKRTVDPHAEQLGTSRPGGAERRLHATPQILQVKFSESENVKRRPPVAIVNGGEWFFLVVLAPGEILQRGALLGICLLYTSDAADDLLCVDLGGRRIIKKKNNKKT